MSCYHPNGVLMVRGEFSRFVGKLSQGKLDAYSGVDDAQLLPVPCGKCEGCRLDRSRYWAERMLLEYASAREGIRSKSALFLTLTYDDAHIHSVMCTDHTYRYTLDKRDPSLFMKRLRKYYDGLGLKIRFYLAGEYGTTTFRPHYHAIIFGATLSDFPDSFVYSSSSRTGDPLYESPTLDSIWSLGAVRYAVANYSTFCYVGRYILKKQFLSDDSSLFYKGRVPPFNRMSLRPGIGSDYFGLDWDNHKAFVSDGQEVHEIGIPRCVLQKIHLINPELYDTIMTTRRKLAAGRMEYIQSQTDLSYMDYLRQQEEVYVSRMRNFHHCDTV